MFLLLVDNHPTMVEERFVKEIFLDGKWVPIGSGIQIDPTHTLKYIKMPMMDLIECQFLAKGKGFNYIRVFSIKKNKKS